MNETTVTQVRKCVIEHVWRISYIQDKQKLTYMKTGTQTSTITCTYRVSMISNSDVSLVFYYISVFQ